MLQNIFFRFIIESGGGGGCIAGSTEILVSTVISEGSCDTKDWNNNCWKFSVAIIGLNYIYVYIYIYVFK